MRSNYSDWYERAYPDLTGHGQWLSGNELNTLDVEEYQARPFRVLIARLSTYFDTAESFSHKILYQIARGQNAVFPDLSYLPPLYDGPLFSNENIPWLLGTATKQGPEGFDLIAFSNAIVQELVNVPVMLGKSAVPLKKSERMDRADVPLIILGGSNALYTSVFFVPDPPIDGVFFGESTDCIARIFSICAQAKAQGRSKEETLALLESVPGFVQPDKPKKTRRRIDPALTLNCHLSDAPVVNLDGQYGKGTLQLSEGCPCFCGYCAESFNRKPYREVDAKGVIAQAAAMKAGMGLDTMELYSFNFNIYSGFYAVLPDLAGLFPSIGLKSQRFDALGRDPDMLSCCCAIGKTSITCGLEGISPRMRGYLHKSLLEEDCRAGLRLIMSSALRELKIFLIITGKEDGRDFEEFEKLLIFVRDLAKDSPASRPPRLIFSATALVRFPWTPLEFEDAPQPEALRPIIAVIRGAVEKSGFEFRMSSDLNDYQLSQIIVRAADSRIYDCLLAALASTGFVYYRSVPSLFINEFVRECGLAGLPAARLLRPAGTLSRDDEKPWLYFETGVRRDFILRQAQAAADFKDIGYCLGERDKPGECKACGACDMTACDTVPSAAADVKAALLSPRPKAPSIATRLRERIAGAASATVPVRMLVDIKETCRGLPRAAASVALAAAVMKTAPGCVPWYRGYANSHLSQKGGPCWLTGDDVLTLLWLRDGLEDLDTIMDDPAAVGRINAKCGSRVTLKQYRPVAPEHYRLSVQSPYRFAPNDYFTRHGLTHLLRKSGEGYVLEFTKQALKKRIITECGYASPAGGGTDLSLTVTMKFDPGEFAKEAFGLDKSNNWVRIRMSSRF